MNCKQAQRDIALWVGQDLDDPRERDDVKRHVSSCPDCRDHFRRMKGTLKVLGRADAPETYVTTGSLWPELATRITDRKAQTPRGRFNGWMPFVAMTAACFVLVLVVLERPGEHGTMGPPHARQVPIFSNPAGDIDRSLIKDNTPRPKVRFEDRDAYQDAQRLKELRRDAAGDHF